MFETNLIKVLFFGLKRIECTYVYLFASHRLYKKEMPTARNYCLGSSQSQHKNGTKKILERSQHQEQIEPEMGFGCNHENHLIFNKKKLMCFEYICWLR